MSRASRIVLCVLACVGGCSTLADPLPQFAECESDLDCAQGQICAEGTQVCLDLTDVPPLAWLGFDIQESLAGQTQPQFRVEVDGCDKEVQDIDIGTLSVQPGDVTQTLRLAVFVEKPQDPENPTLEELLEATFEIRQPSRFARAPTPLRRSVSHPTLEDDQIVDTRLRWPRYHPRNDQPPPLRDGGFLLWTITPPAGNVAPRYQMLVPPAVFEDEPCSTDADCEGLSVSSICTGDINNAGFCRPETNPLTTYEFVYNQSCNRPLRGSARIIDDVGQTTGLEGASVLVRHAVEDSDPEDRFGIAALGKSPEEPQCTTDAQCIEGEQFCSEEGQCLLDLDGRVANTSSTASDASGSLETRVYTYCEGQETDPLTRWFSVTLFPAEGTARPQVNYSTEANFSPPMGVGDTPAGTIVGDLCVPNWGPPLEIQLALRGEPQLLASTDDGDYMCCDTSCLPSDADAAEENAPTSAGTCTGRTSAGPPPTLRLETPLTLSQEEFMTWTEAGCATPVADDDGFIGRLRPSISCPSDPQVPCAATSVAGGVGNIERKYTLRVEMPPGSLFASQDVAIDVPAAGTDVPFEVNLQRRLLVRGRVVLPSDICDPATAEDGDCGSDGAFVLAERLRVPDELAAETPGPYFHQIETYYSPGAEASKRKGHYVLPLDRGVWVLTALPSAGNQGGPARYEILDLRDVEAAPTDLDFVLEQGIPVSLDLLNFDRRATVAPLDRGTWADTMLPHPSPPTEDPFVDLNRVGECWIAPNEDQGQACKIRRLIPGASRSLSQEQKARFSARVADGGDPTICGGG